MLHDQHATRYVSKLSNKLRRKIDAFSTRDHMSGSQGKVLHFLLTQTGDVFQKDIHVYESVVNKADKIFIGIVNKGDEAEWCVATTDQEVLQPVVEEVFERNDNLEFKKYKQSQSTILN